MNYYLDAASTTKPDPKVIEVMMPYFTEKWYNPSSLYGKASLIKHDTERARLTVANYIGAQSSEIFFTSGGSESNCWAIQGFVNYWVSKGEKPFIITSTIEHKSIIDCVKNLNNINSFYIDVDKDGFIDLQELESLLIHNPNKKILISIQMANNEIGTIQNIKRISSLVHKYNAIFHTDATQAFGQISIDVDELGIDMMTASGHKVHTPKGIGFLYKKNGIEIKPLIYGSQMDSMRGGTENVPYIIGLEKAVKLLQKKSTERQLKLPILRDNFISQLKGIGCKVNGSIINRLPNNISVTFPHNITGEGLLYTLDLSGIQVSTGSACNSHSISPSYVLKAIGLTDEEAVKTVRFTLTEDITGDDIDFIVNEINKSIKIIEA